MKSLILPILCGLLASCALPSNQSKLTTVPQVDSARYLGKWYEIARYPNSFEKGHQQVTANYTLLKDGTIEVLNQGVTKDGAKQAKGSARIVEGSNNTKLRVSFFGPFEGDYWVIGLDEKDYSWAIVGEPSRQYLWILSRKPKMSEALYNDLLKKVAKKGYDPAKLEKTVQK